MRALLVLVVLALCAADASAGPIRRLFSCRPGVLIPKRTAQPAPVCSGCVGPSCRTASAPIAVQAVAAPVPVPARECWNGSCPAPARQTVPFVFPKK